MFARWTNSGNCAVTEGRGMLHTAGGLGLIIIYVVHGARVSFCRNDRIIVKDRLIVL